MDKNEDFNSDNPVKTPSEKICKGKCGKMRPLSDFNNNRTKKDGKQETCRQCQSEFMRDYNARRAFQQRQQITAGDVQLDPAPVSVSTPATRRVKLPDKKAAKQALLADLAEEKVKLPMPSPVYLTDDEKRTLIAGLDKYIAGIDAIIEKLR